MQRVLSSIVRLLRAGRALSLDIVVGVLCGALFASASTGARLPIGWYVALGGATWVVYLVDHLLDVRRASRAHLTERHAFVSRHRSALVAWVVVLSSLTTAVAAATLPREALPWVPVLVAAAVFHLVRAQRPRRHWLPKEVTGAIVYVAGIWFVPLAVGRPGAWTWVLIALHGVAALLNLAAFSHFDRGADRRDGRRSLVRDWGARASAGFVLGLGFATFTIAALLAVSAPATVRPATIVLLPLIVAPPLLLRHFDWFARRERYRIADALFVLLALPPVLS